MRTILTTWLVIFSASVSLAQAPQGVGTNYSAVVDVSGDLVLLNREGGILYSEDEGETIQLLYQAEEDADNFLGLGVAGDIVVAVGTDGLIRRADFSVSNTNWVEVAGGDILGELRAVATDGAGTWVAVGEGALLSVDNAISWVVGEDVPLGLYSVDWNAFGTNWVAVGQDEMGYPMAYTFDGDETIEVAELPLDMPWEVLRAVAADGFGNVLAVGHGGTVIISDDNGSTYTLADVDVTQDLYAVIAVGENQWIFGGQERLLISLHGGSSSILLDTDSSAGDIQSIVPLGGFYFLAGVDEFDFPMPEDAGIFTSITRSGMDVVLVLGEIEAGVWYELQETQDLTANPVDWMPEGTLQSDADGIQVQWIVPIRDGLRIYRAVIP